MHIESCVENIYLDLLFNLFYFFTTIYLVRKIYPLPYHFYTLLKLHVNLMAHHHHHHHQMPFYCTLLLLLMLILMSFFSLIPCKESNVLGKVGITT